MSSAKVYDTITGKPRHFGGLTSAEIKHMVKTISSEIIPVIDCRAGVTINDYDSLRQLASIMNSWNDSPDYQKPGIPNTRGNNRSLGYACKLIRTCPATPPSNCVSVAPRCS